MIVEKIMKRDVVTLSRTDTIEEAMKRMRTFHIKHLPVINERGTVVGVVTDRDVKKASPSIFAHNSSAKDLQRPVELIMSKEVVTGHPLDFAEEISAVFFEHDIGCLPIVKNGKLVGIVTKSDLLHTFVQLTGAHFPGSQIEIKTEDITQGLADISPIFSKRQIGILSVLVYPGEKEHSKILVFRVQTMNPASIIKDVKTKGYQVLWPAEQRDLL
ncbi:acetoin utilization AcuB family protein [Bacillus swezeyi]|uniref:Acetoin utilization protein AcuB n=1 Tax=Bacillus swezeyi TaxID=1925020 RepID=A0A1R1RWU4_9BACI|nr:acetoin utilization AcuB family protein [Bacillus swezeyi]MEC1263044.1 acetoin utilization AcuB family protein [Bacillus swezeyi]MED2930428.1 acetoin utilization AcuB family protein [Bacillus swezeyi]MED2963970.1 acetoin utilization AcuB family protein [Bacillus swezeyi]MED2975222.1 acetoin utilization AcuB family protein [Bacillus swezeyi]MED3074539.1 acetoin utilization AcuB family protein [Bacillus swezeyi]